MLLSEIVWYRITDDVSFAPVGKGVVYRLTHPQHGFVYTIQPVSTSKDGCWFSVDVLTARAILFHLTAEGNNKVTP